MSATAGGGGGGGKGKGAPQTVNFGRRGFKVAPVGARGPK